MVADRPAEAEGPRPASSPRAIAASNPQRWIQLVAAGLIIVATQALPIYGGAILIPQMANTLSFSRTEVGFISSSFMISLGVLSFVSGALINRFGTRAAFAFGTAILVVGATLIAELRLSWLEMAMINGILVGAGTAIGGMIPGVTHVSRWFMTARAFAMTVVFCMMSLGGALGVGILTVIDGPEQDWRAGWRFVAICAFVALVLALTVLRESPQPGRTAPLGLIPGQEGTDREAHKRLRRLSAGRALRTRLFGMLLLAATGTIVATGLLTGHGMLNLLDLGLPRPQAASVIAAFPAAALVGKLAIGFVGDRVDPRISAGIATLSCGLGLIGMPFSASFGLALLSAILIGLGFGGVIVCTPLVLVNRFGQVPLTSLTSTIQGVQTISSAVVILLTGVVYDLGGGYTPLFAAAGIFCCVVGAALSLLAPDQRTIGVEAAIE